MTGDRRPGLAVSLRVEGRRCLVVGAGPVGTRRAATLLDCGAHVVVVAPEVSAELESLGSGAALELLHRRFAPSDVGSSVLVVAATGDPAVDAEVCGAAVEAGSLVNCASRPELGQVQFPGLVSRGPLQVAVSTGGSAPAVASLVARRLDEGLDLLLGLDLAGVTTLVAIVEEIRAELRAGQHGATHVTGATLNWRSALDGSILELVNQGRSAEAKERLLACLSS